MEGSSEGTANSGGTMSSGGASGSDGAAGASDEDNQPTVTNTWSQPPDLMQRSGAPRYDAQDLARMVGVATNVLWNWEQSLGVPRPIRVRDASGSFLPRYSDRDVLAVLWLRDQIRAGASAVEAARRLFLAQRPSGPLQAGRVSGPLASAPTSGPLTRGATSGGLQSPAPPSLRGVAPPTGSIGLGSATSGPLNRPGAMQPSPGLGMDPMRFTSGPLNRGPISAPTSGPIGLGQAIAPVSGPIRGPATQGFASGAALPPQPAGGWSHPLQSGIWSQPQPGGPTGTVHPSQSLYGTGGLRMLQGALLRACAALDVSECHSVLEEAFGNYPVETVCIRLLAPVVTRAAEMASVGQFSQVAERLAQVTIRDRLAALLDEHGAPAEAPIALLACAPGEYHEIGPLMLGVLWRRAGLRAIYLGPDITESALISESRARRPFLICLSAATEVGARGIAHATSALARLDPPRPIVGYGGAAFVRAPQWQARIHDAYFLGVDAMTATRHVLQLLTDGPLMPH